jgi:hypothetical protein
MCVCVWGFTTSITCHSLRQKEYNRSTHHYMNGHYVNMDEDFQLLSCPENLSPIKIACVRTNCDANRHIHL